MSPFPLWPRPQPTERPVWANAFRDNWNGERNGKGMNVTELQQSEVGVGVVVSGTDGDFAGVGTLSAKATPEDGGFELVRDNQQ